MDIKENLKSFKYDNSFCLISKNEYPRLKKLALYVLDTKEIDLKDLKLLGELIDKAYWYIKPRYIRDNNKLSHKLTMLSLLKKILRKDIKDVIFLPDNRYQKTWITVVYQDGSDFAMFGIFEKALKSLDEVKQAIAKDFFRDYLNKIVHQAENIRIKELY